ncbi:MAG: HepT-like ribonuclease domain-containing protein [Clostridium sp.]|uniref:HepT-like ribonuclease domain-containing protein n=1 Tax=Clostridium sp. TaxID=1506 RepID=UPI003F3B3E2B
MSPYYKYKKEKFIEKYKNALENLDLLKESIFEYKKTQNKLIRRAMFAFFQDFTEYIIDMCETYLVVNNIPVGSANSGIKLINKANEEGFFDSELKGYLVMCVKLRNRYTHDYYDREECEKSIEAFCFNEIANLEIFLEESKEKVILKFKKNDR